MRLPIGSWPRHSLSATPSLITATAVLRGVARGQVAAARCEQHRRRSYSPRTTVVQSRQRFLLLHGSRERRDGPDIWPDFSSGGHGRAVDGGGLEKLSSYILGRYSALGFIRSGKLRAPRVFQAIDTRDDSCAPSLLRRASCDDTADFNYIDDLIHGSLLPIGRVILALTPLITAKVRPTIRSRQ